MKEWDDWRVVELNREPAHDLNIPMRDESQLTSQSMESSPYYLSLNGIWKFHWSPDPSSAPAQFYSDGYSTTGWDDITVPYPWQVYGVRNSKNWDKPMYTNITYPFAIDYSNFSVMTPRPSNFTYNSSMMNPVGCYKRSFKLPANWDGRDIYVRFNGAGHGYYVWVNGKFVGYAEDSYLPSEWNITSKLHSGENTIAVQVYRFTTGSYLEDQDYWRLTGIMRDVFLWSAPKTQIRDYFFRTDSLSADGTEARALLDVSITGDKLGKPSFTAVIKDGGRVVAECHANKTGQFTLNFSHVTGIEPWSAENPKLYDLVMTLRNGKKIVDQRGMKVGFHTIKAGPRGELMVNGKETIIRGVNRHDFSEITGRTVSREECERDIRLMKRLNINTIRTSHYPDNPFFYDLCDRYGIYVIGEANVESHGAGYGSGALPHYHQFEHAIVQRSVRQVLTYRNHACIFVWSLGNESGPGDDLKAARDSIKAIDPTRLIHYERDNSLADINSSMYASVDWMREQGEYALTQSRPKPRIQCENTHSMGNSEGNQREYYELYYKYPSLAGECIWDWKDQGLKMTASDGSTYWAYGGDFGDQPNSGDFCCNGVIFPDYSLSAKAYSVKKIYQPLDFVMDDSLSGSFTLISRLCQRNLNYLNVGYKVFQDDGKVLREGTIHHVDIAPGDSMKANLGSMVSGADDDAEVFIRFSATQKATTLWADAGYEVAAECFRLRAPLYRSKVGQDTGRLKVTQNDSVVKVTGDHFEAVFSNGLLSSYTYQGKKMLSAPLRLNVFRIPTDNDDGGAQYNKAWDRLGLRDLTLQAGGFDVTRDDNRDRVTLRVTDDYKGSNISFCTTQSFRVYADGTIVVNNDVMPSVTGVQLPKLGFRTEMPAGFEQMTWLGRGPMESYRDRKEAQFVGLYTDKVSNQWTHYVLPQENGNHEDVRWMGVTDSEGDGMLFIAPDNMATTVGHWRSEEMYVNADDRARHTNEAKFCDNTVVSLDAYNRALGNASCGPDVLSKYKITSERCQFRFILKPVSDMADSAALARAARVTDPTCKAVTISEKQGHAVLSTTMPDATIHYSLDGINYAEYTTPVDMRQGGTLFAFSTREGFDKSGLSSRTFGSYVDKCPWRVVGYDSYMPDNEPANAIDGNSETFWHTQWDPDVPMPHHIIVDMGKSVTLSAFTYKGRADGMSNGRIAEYQLYMTNDTTHWGAPVAKGTFANTDAVQTVPLPELSARYFKLVALSEVNGNAWTSAAELGVEAKGGVKSCDAVEIKDEKGKVKLSTSTRGATIYYSVNRGDYQRYKKPLDLSHGGILTAYCVKEGYAASSVSTRVYLP